MSDIAVTEPAGLPARRYDTSTEITRDDVALPRIKKGEHMSAHVQEGRVKYGAIFSELGSDDPDPVVLAKEGDPESEPLTFYVLSGPVKGWSYSNDGELETWAWDDPDRHPDAWKTYKYVIAIPDQDETLPYTILFTRTSAPAAKQLNLLLAKASQLGDPSAVPFTLTGKKRSSDKYKWVIFQVRRGDVKPAVATKHAKIVEDLRDLASAGAGDPPAADRPSDAVSDAPPVG